MFSRARFSVRDARRTCNGGLVGKLVSFLKDEVEKDETGVPGKLKLAVKFL